MSTTRLSRSTPFWVLVGGSVVTIAGGAYLLVSKLTLMASTLTDGTATGVEVYAGQIWAVLGAILVGVGAIGLALALTLGALRTIVAPAPAVWEEEVVEIAAPAFVEAPASEGDVSLAAAETAPETRAAARAASAESSEPVETSEPVEASEPVETPAAEASEPVIAFGDEAPASESSTGASDPDATGTTTR